MKTERKKIKRRELSREESIRKVILDIYLERKRNSDREEANRIKRIRELTKGKKIEIDNSKDDPSPNKYTLIEAQ